MAKIEAGHVALESAPVDLGALVQEVMGMMRVHSEKKDLELLLDLPSDLPHPVISDVSKLRQILISFIDNAIRYTERGSVTLRLAVKTGESCHGLGLIFEVMDYRHWHRQRGPDAPL